MEKRSITPTAGAPASAGATPNGAPPKKPSTKERILAAALSLFAEKGFEETTVQDIARSVGIKAASLYAHFKGKNAIFRAVLSGAMDSWRDAIEDCFRKAGEETPTEKSISDILHQYVLHATRLESYRFWARLYIFPPRTLGKREFQAFMDLDARFGAKLLEYCRRGTREKAGDREIEILVSCLVRIAWGFIVCARGGDAADALKKETRAEVRLILKGFDLSQLEERE